MRINRPFVLVSLLLGADAIAQTTTRESLSSAGLQDTSLCGEAAVSADGRYVAFRGNGAGLVPNDTNGTSDVFVRDRVTGQTTLVSKDSNGVQGNGASGAPDISADGRYVLFQSLASNLVPGDTNAAPDIFRHDRLTGTTIRVSVGDAGQQAVWATNGSISGDGRYVAFQSPDNALVTGDADPSDDIFLRDCASNTTVLVSHGTGSVATRQNPRISSDGNFVVFDTPAYDLVPGDINAHGDVFVWSRTTGAITLVSQSTTGAAGNGDSSNAVLSADGRYVAFMSYATNFFVGDTLAADIFVHDRVLGTTTCVSTGLAGQLANNGSSAASISGDGRFVTFRSLASNLVSSDTNNQFDIFVRDLATATTSRASVTAAGAQAGSASDNGRISRDGRWVVFQSSASNIVVPDSNGGIVDVYLRDTGAIASALAWGAGCPGTGGIVPAITNASWPIIGNAAFGVAIDHALPSSLAVVFWNTTSANVPLSGCDVLVAAPINVQPVVFLDAAGVGTSPFPIPNDPTLASVDVFFQSLVIDPNGPFLGLGALSNGLAARIGN